MEPKKLSDEEKKKIQEDHKDWYRRLGELRKTFKEFGVIKG